MSAEDFDPVHVANCGMCEYALHRREAELGERCRDCLERFDRPWRQPVGETGMCPTCVRNAEHRATAPRFAGRYGSRGSE